MILCADPDSARVRVRVREKSDLDLETEFGDFYKICVKLSLFYWYQFLIILGCSKVVVLLIGKHVKCKKQNHN